MLWWTLGSAENEKETDLGEVLFGDEKAHLYFIEGTLIPSNWSFFELKWKGHLRIILDSTEGDADLYLSSRQVIHFYLLLATPCILL